MEKKALCVCNANVKKSEFIITHNAIIFKGKFRTHILHSATRETRHSDTEFCTARSSTFNIKICKN